MRVPLCGGRTGRAQKMFPGHAVRPCTQSENTRSSPQPKVPALPRWSACQCPSDLPISSADLLCPSLVNATREAQPQIHSRKAAPQPNNAPNRLPNGSPMPHPTLETRKANRRPANSPLSIDERGCKRTKPDVTKGANGCRGVRGTNCCGTRHVWGGMVVPILVVVSER